MILHACAGGKMTKAEWLKVQKHRRTTVAKRARIQYWWTARGFEIKLSNMMSDIKTAACIYMKVGQYTLCHEQRKSVKFSHAIFGWRLFELSSSDRRLIVQVTNCHFRDSQVQGTNNSRNKMADRNNAPKIFRAPVTRSNPLQQI